MDKMLYLNNLYDCYKDLLTEKQQGYFEDYYRCDLSLSEIAINDNVSRNAVHGQLKIIEKKLLQFEDKLKLYDRKNKIMNLLDKVSDKDIASKIEDLL